MATMSLDGYLALADDKEIDRELIEGRVYERPHSFRTPAQGYACSACCWCFGNWDSARLRPDRGFVGVDIGTVLSRDPAVVVGIDFAYFDGETNARQNDDCDLMVGVPVAAFVILPRQSEREVVAQRVSFYLRYGASVVWVIDPNDRSVTLNRSRCSAERFADNDEVSCEPELPGLRVKASCFFYGEG